MTTTDPQPTGTATIVPAELVRMREQDPAVHVIDVRTPGEFETGHIEGSYNVPLDLLGEHVSDLAALDHNVVLVCQSGARATKALEQLVAAGKSNLRLLEGGMSAWTASGNRVARTNATRWPMDRQVRLVAGSIVLASVAASVWFPPARFVGGFIGAGLTFSAVTNTCGMAMALAKLPYNRGASCDMRAVLDELTTTEAKA
ncbi:MAG: rhodanese-like domain-containing protein [Acidimicrobiia bacterium]|jgi:rhodanese-related sulfurtransferase